MTQPRKALVSLKTTPYYHITSRCVRKAYLCGTDRDTNTSYEHRRQWVEDRIRLLSSIFAIDICAYAVMSNHYHLVLKLNPNQTKKWSNTEVIKRWEKLYSSHLLIQRIEQHSSLTPEEQASADDIIEKYRQRLGDLGWFMRSLNLYIAVEANKEDECTGSFWEGRYKSQALKTEHALLAAMTYVDLNPIRAKIASTPETSDHTSIKERIQSSFDLSKAVKDAICSGVLKNFAMPLKPLVPFKNSSIEPGNCLPFCFSSYIQLIDWTGRLVLKDKPGAINPTLPPILERFDIDQTADWIKQSTQFEEQFRKQAFKSNSHHFANTG